MDALNGLVVTRRPQEFVQLDTGPRAIRIQVIRINAGECAFRIDAPRDMPIVRGELLSAAEQAPLPRGE